MTEQGMEYQNEPGNSQSQERLDALTSDVTTTPEAQAAQRERVMFEKHVQDGGESIPENFKTAGDWFDSLKESQRMYTQGQQEMSALKEQYNEGGTVNPNYKEPEATIAEPAVEEARVPNNDAELRIGLKPNEPEVAAPAESRVTDDVWNQWGAELAVNGELSAATKDSIKASTGFTDAIIDDFVSGQKAKMREAYSSAASVVGGKEHLDKIFTWAETNLSQEEQATINMGLSSPSYEVTLRGLEAMYNSKSVESVKGQEPQGTANTGQVSGTDTGFVGYTTKREFTADRNNPRFKLEPQYRQAVEQRMMRTDFNSLPR